MLPASCQTPLTALVQQAVDSCALLASGPIEGQLLLEAGAWRIGLSQLGELQRTLNGRGLELVTICSSQPHTHVAAAGLGILSQWPNSTAPESPAKPDSDLQVHRGTLRSGDHLETSGSVLLLGDVNPGARISAAGHVLVWGRLRGVAHAGCQGDNFARIVALQLRPLQLRIAGAVARGPEGAPPAGFAEEARIVAGAIQIDPAQPAWPLSG
ncbi:septum site-determining protein MinC [Cyanobium sp. Maggiore-St4-Cus]|uniref:septum site-determining protein MinC n=1 Tax=Cyanobium sp. Maggiore-St4-Cus TaxID=2823717 RepID=UPI0020CFD3C8|nr:septum site-determining protein MinC [Cyanobium sp. Maggiore-St4-Cus]